MRREIVYLQIIESLLSEEMLKHCFASKGTILCNHGNSDLKQCYWHVKRYQVFGPKVMCYFIGCL